MVLGKESAHNPRKAWQEVNRLLGRGGRREVEVLKTEIGEMTDKQEIVIFCICCWSKGGQQGGNELELNVKSKFSFRQIGVMLADFHSPLSA